MRRFQPVKIEPVIIYASRIVLKRRLKMAGESAPHGEQLFQRTVLQRRMLLQKTIQVVNVCLEMPVMVKMHCFFIDKRFECIIGVRQGSVDKRIIVVHDKFLKFFLTVYERTSAYITYDKAAGLLFSEL